MHRPLLATKRHLLAGGLLLALLLGFLAQPFGGHAEPRQPAERFRWVSGLDDLTSRDGGPHLSRPAATAPSATIPLPDPSFALRFAHYPASDEMALFLHQLQVAYPDVVVVTEIGQSWQGRPILAVRVGNAATGDPETRPAMYVDGGLHAREVVSTSAALYLVWYLAAHFGDDPLVTRLLDTRTVYAIPCVNPDGNDIFLTSDQRQRKNANPSASDDDRDGWFDEDGREGAGYGTYDLYHYEFDAEWVQAHPEDPFASAWGDHLIASTFVGIFDAAGSEVPQVDDDGDGQKGEDPPGGVDPNRNFDMHWDMGEGNPTKETYRGANAFSEPEARAVRDYIRARPHIVTAVSFQSGSDILLHPWAWSGEAELPDRFWFEMLSRKGSQLTEVHGFQGAPHTWTARGLYTASGSEMDWTYDLGMLSWTPEIYGASTLAYAQRITATNTYSVGVSLGQSYNPAPAEIAPTVHRWLDWSMYLLAATPNVELAGAQAHDGGLVLSVANDGVIPMDVVVAVETVQGTYSTTMTYLSAGERTWSVPLQRSGLTQVLTVTLTGACRVGGVVRPAQIETMTLEVEGQEVHVLQGRVLPFVDLGAAFGGWFAGREWDTPEYHLGPPLLSEQYLPMVAR